MNLTLADFLTVAGVAAAAAFATGIVALVKAVFPVVDARVSGAVMVFILTAILYVLAGVSTGAATLDAWFAVFVAWVTCATAAVGVYSTVQHVSDQR